MDAGFFRAWMAEIAAVVEIQRDHLTQLDAAIGDADHGINLSRGFGAVQAALAQADTPTPGSVLVLTGTTLISKVGGASGPLYGTAFRRAGKALGDSAEVDLAALAAGLEAALAGVQKLGAAQRGRQDHGGRACPGGKRVQQGRRGEGAARRRPRRARRCRRTPVRRRRSRCRRMKGRASYLGPRSVGHEDPGAASTALIMRALHDVALRQAP